MILKIVASEQTKQPPHVPDKKNSVPTIVHETSPKQHQTQTAMSDLTTCMCLKTMHLKPTHLKAMHFSLLHFDP